MFRSGGHVFTFKMYCQLSARLNSLKDLTPLLLVALPVSLLPPPLNFTLPLQRCRQHPVIQQAASSALRSAAVMPKPKLGIAQSERPTSSRYDGRPPTKKCHLLTSTLPLQLEQTVTKLQAALGYSPEQVSTLPPSSVTIRELQQDNLRLQKEIEDLRRALADAGGGHRRGALAPYDPRGCDRESYKRKKSSSYLDGVYMVSVHC